MFICFWNFAAFPRDSDIKDDDITYKVSNSLTHYGLSFYKSIFVSKTLLFCRNTSMYYSTV